MLRSWSTGIFLLCLFFVSGVLAGQELGFRNSWSVSTGFNLSNIRSVRHQSYPLPERALIQVLEGERAGIGFQLGAGRYTRFSRQNGLVMEAHILQSIRRAHYSAVYSGTELISTKSGEFSYNNVYGQAAFLLRRQFGMFNRFYLQAGPYLDFNLINLSTFNGRHVTYFEETMVNGMPVLAPLHEPHTTDQLEKHRTNRLDAGGALSAGTLLALPGNHCLQLELRYSRGVFRIGDITGVRQNRWTLLLSYLIPERPAKGYHRYQPYQL